MGVTRTNMLVKGKLRYHKYINPFLSFMRKYIYLLFILRIFLTFCLRSIGFNKRLYHGYVFIRK